MPQSRGGSRWKVATSYGNHWVMMEVWVQGAPRRPCRRKDPTNHDFWYPPYGGPLNQNEISLPGKPVAYNYGLLSINYGLLYGIVACYFKLLGVPGMSTWSSGPYVWVVGITMPRGKVRCHGFAGRAWCASSRAAGTSFIMSS